LSICSRVLFSASTAIPSVSALAYLNVFAFERHLVNINSRSILCAFPSSVCGFVG
jgi:hypothetical protein